MTRLKRLAASVALLALPAVWSAAWAQEVVQPLPPAGTDELNGALRRLAADPRDVTALLDAGDAALKVGDVDGAMGFFGRARDLSPENARVKMGMATAFARTRRPVEALRLFAEAETAGADPAAMAADRGLAFDLVGDAASAQANYRLAIQHTNDPELVRRLALSQAISGDRTGFEATLLPLLQKRDLAAFRTRAFGLAILGDVDESVQIAQTMMTREMAARMTPYLETMPQLTQAQQAAAGNLGVFPRGVGRSASSVHTATAKPMPPRVAASSPTPPRVKATVAPGPAAQRADSQARDWRGRVRPRSDREEHHVAQATQTDHAKDAPRVPLPPPIPVMPALRTSSAAPSESPTVTSAAAPTGSEPASSQVGELPPVAPSRAPAMEPSAERQALVSAPAVTPAPSTTLAPAPASASPVVPPAPTPAPVPVRVPPASTPAPVPVSVPPASTPTSAPVSAPPVVAPAPVPAATSSAPPEPQPAEEVSLADAFASFVLPSSPTPAASAGAVDITAIRIPREVAKPEPEPAKPEPSAKPEAKKPEPKKVEPKKPAKPAQPARQWVQVATGKSLSALKFDWRRIAKKADGKLDKKGPFTTPWVEANRLLAGPFDSPAAAKEMVKQLKAAGLDSFTYSSPEGEEIKPLK